MTQRQVGPYRLLDLLGRGGMGEVFRAHDTGHEREVALKLLPEHLAADEEFRARFQNEARITAALTDPHVVPIHRFGEIEGRLFLDMRLIEGEDLSAVLARDRLLSPARAVAIVEQVASALDSAHEHGLVHRDVKPSNVLLVTPRPGRPDFAYLGDFGISAMVGSTPSTRITATGAAVGTLDYMAPERFQGGVVDGRADVYSLACLFYELITGLRPFPAEEMVALLYAHAVTPPPRPSEHGVPVALDAVVATGMAKRPEERYATAGEFAEEAALACADLLSMTSGRAPVTVAPRVVIAGLATQIHPEPFELPGDATAQVGTGQTTATPTTGTPIPAPRRPPPMSDPRLQPVLQAPPRRQIGPVPPPSRTWLLPLATALAVALVLVAGGVVVARSYQTPEPVRTVAAPATTAPVATLSPAPTSAAAPVAVAPAPQNRRTSAPRPVTPPTTTTTPPAAVVEPPKVTVPNVVGQSEADASAALSNAGLTTRTRSASVDEQSKAGVVVAQSVAAGTSADKGSTVTISVGEFVSPDPPVPPPGFVGN